MLRRLRLRRGWRDRPLRGGVMARHLPCRVSSWRCGPSWAGRRTRTCLVWRMVWGILLGTLCGEEMPSLAWIERAHTYGCAVSVAVPSCRGCASTFGKYIKKRYVASVISAVSCMLLLSKLRGCTDQWIIDIVGRASEHSVDSALDARSIPVHLHSTFDPWSPTKRGRGESSHIMEALNHTRDWLEGVISDEHRALDHLARLCESLRDGPYRTPPRAALPAPLPPPRSTHSWLRGEPNPFAADALDHGSFRSSFHSSFRSGIRSGIRSGSCINRPYLPVGPPAACRG